MNLFFSKRKKENQDAGTVKDEDIVEYLLSLVHGDPSTYGWYKMIISKWLTDKLPVAPDEINEE